MIRTRAFQDDVRELLHLLNCFLNNYDDAHLEDDDEDQDNGLK